MVRVAEADPLALPCRSSAWPPKLAGTACRLARQIRPFIAIFQSGLTLVTDTSSQAQSEYWQAFLALYGALVKTSEHDAMLAAEVEDLIKFMANAKRAAPPEAAPAAPPTGGEPPPK